MDKTSYKNQIIWGTSLFMMIFVSANIAFELGGKLTSGVSISKVAAVSEVVVPEAIDTPVVAAPVIVTEVPVTPVAEKVEVKNIKLAFVGDIMLDRGVKDSVYKNFAGDYNQLLSKVKNQLRNYNLLYGNLEGPVSDRGTNGYALYSFRFEPKVVPVLKEAGFDVLSLSNNHVFNWGEVAFTDTLQALSEMGIIYSGGGFVGAKAYQEKVINVEGVKIAFLSFSQIKDGGVASDSLTPGIALISEKDVQESVSRVKGDSDLVVVAFHFGEEYQTEPNEYQKKYAELAIDSGASLVVGNHPHVVQTFEQYKNTYIIYSLGNFIFDQYFSPETMSGGLLEVEVNPESKKIEKATLKKILINKKYQVESIE